MVRTTAQNNTCHVVIFQVFYGFFAFFVHVMTEVFPFCPASFHSRFDFFCIAAHGNEFVCHTFDDGFNLIQREERIHELDVLFFQILYVVFDVFVIRCHDRAVIVVVSRCAVPSFVNDTRIEDEVYTLFDEVHDMTVYQFCGIANGFTGDGFHTLFKDCLCGIRGQYHTIAQFCEECEPERIVFPHIQHTRDTNGASGCLFCCEGFIVKQSMAFVIIQVRCGIFVLFFAQTSFTTVACDESSAAAELVDGQQTVVGAALASSHSGLDFQCIHFFTAYQCCLVAFCIFISCDEPCAESTHDAGDVRTNGFSAADEFKAFQYSVVIECTALYNHGFTHSLRVSDFDHFQQCVFDNGICQTCGNIRNVCPFFLCLFYTGVHENSTSGTQVDGRFCEKGNLREVRNGVIQRFCESFDEGTAAGRTCFVQQYAVDDAILDTDTFHILTTDVQNEVYIRFEELRCFIVGNGFDVAQVHHQCFFDEAFAVTGYAGIADGHAFRHQVVHFIQTLHNHFQRVAFVACVEGIKQVTLFADQSHLCSGGTSVDTQEGIAFVCRKRYAFYFIFIMAFFEHRIIIFVFEQRIQTAYFCGQFCACFQTAQQSFKVQVCFAFVGNGCAVCCEEVRVFRQQCCFVCQVQCFDETLAQFREEMQRATQKCHMAADRFTTCQTGNGLVNNCLENGSCQVFLSCPIVDEGLDVCFCEYTTAGSDGINHFMAFCVFVQTCCVCVQQACHLVDEGTGTAGTYAVHTLFHIPAGEINDFRIFAAQFDGNICLGHNGFDGVSSSNHFLNEVYANGFCQGNAAGAGDHGCKFTITQFFLSFCQDFFYGFLNFGKMSAIATKNNFICRICQHDFDCCRTDIDPHFVCLFIMILHCSHPHVNTSDKCPVRQCPARAVLPYICTSLRHQWFHPAPSAPGCRPA